METPREYLEAIIKRTRELRESSKIRQFEMAELLGIDRNRYVHYERVSSERLTMLPVHLIPRFCELVGCSAEYLMTGKEHPVVAAYQAMRGENKVIVDKFLGLSQDDPLDPPLHSGVHKSAKQHQR